MVHLGQGRRGRNWGGANKSERLRTQVDELVTVGRFGRLAFMVSAR